MDVEAKKAYKKFLKRLGLEKFFKPKKSKCSQTQTCWCNLWLKSTQSSQKATVDFISAIISRISSHSSALWIMLWLYFITVKLCSERDNYVQCMAIRFFNNKNLNIFSNRWGNMFWRFLKIFSDYIFHEIFVNDASVDKSFGWKNEWDFFRMKSFICHLKNIFWADSACPSRWLFENGISTIGHALDISLPEI